MSLPGAHLALHLKCWEIEAPRIHDPEQWTGRNRDHHRFAFLTGGIQDAMRLPPASTREDTIEEKRNVILRGRLLYRIADAVSPRGKRPHSDIYWFLAMLIGGRIQHSEIQIERLTFPAGNSEGVLRIRIEYRVLNCADSKFIRCAATHRKSDHRCGY